MPTPQPGITGLSNLRQGIQYLIQSATATNEHEGKLRQLCERHQLTSETDTWVETQAGQIQARHVGEHEEWDDPQQYEIVDVVRIKPRAIVCQVVVTDPTSRHMSKKTWRSFGMQSQNAMSRMIDLDGLDAFNGATLESANTSAFDMEKLRAYRTLMQSGHDPVKGMLRVVMHGFQKLDIEDDLVGNAEHQNFGEMSRGITARVFTEGMMLKTISGVGIFTDDNIQIVANNAYAVMFPKAGMILVEDTIRNYEVERRPRYGEGARGIIRRARFNYGARRPTRWHARLQSDATAPS